MVIENAALRLQLRAFQRTRRRPVLTGSDGSVANSMATTDASVACFFAVASGGETERDVDGSDLFSNVALC
jgi:hypothetical protein